MIEKLNAYRLATVEYAHYAIAARAEGKTVTEAEWAANEATNGVTMSFPLEVSIWAKS